MDSRSKRPSQPKRPSYPQVPLASAAQSPSTSSVFQSSSSSLASLSSTTFSAASMAATQPLHQDGFRSAAPLPSPSTAQPASYFASQQQTQPSRFGPQQPAHSTAAISAPYPGQTGAAAAAVAAPETAPFLRDFNLLAEAAKRAEVACLTRDLGDVGL